MISFIRYISGGLLAALMVAAGAATASAATRTWDGGSAVNNTWMTAANWQGDIAPVAGDSLIFPAGVADKATENNFPVGTEFNSIALEGQGYSINGNRFVLVSTISKTGGGTGTVLANVTLKGGAIGGPFNVILSVESGSDALRMQGVIDGIGAVPATLMKTGAGWLEVAGANTYAGLTTIVGGVWDAKHPQAFGMSTAGTSVNGIAQIILDADVLAEPLSLETQHLSALTCQGPPVCVWGGPIHITGPDTGVSVIGGNVLRLSGVVSGETFRTLGPGTVEFGGSNNYTGFTSGNASLRLNGNNRLPATTHVAVSATFDLNGFSQTIAGLLGSSISAETKIGAGTLTLDSPAGTDDFYAAKISGTGSLVKKGEGTQRLFKQQPFSGLTTIQAGTLWFEGSLNGPVSLQGGTFRAWGTVKALTATGGRLEVGPDVNRLVTNALTLSAGATLVLDINGDYAGGEYDQVRTEGAVSLGNATLKLNAHPDLTQIFSAIIIDNRTATPVTGTFAGLQEGAIVTSNGKAFAITYHGGDGNDVVLEPASYDYYLSEGATGPFFDLDILIANPNDAPAKARLTFLLPDGSTVVEERTVGAKSRLTVRVDQITAVSDTSVSTIVTSIDRVPLIVERTMRWGQGGYGAHTEQAVSGTAFNWYFAEGAQGFFSTYLLLANPQAAANNATVTYLRENAPAVVRTYPLEPKSRFTVDAGADPELVGRSFGMRVTFDQPGVAERSMYFGEDPFWKAGHESAGVTMPSKTWFLAEGATGAFFETFILMANPTDEASNVTVRFLPSTGAPVEKQYALPAFGRHTINIEAEDPSLANAAVATSVEATKPIVVERAQYWPDPAPQWYEAHNSFGVVEALHQWGLAEGRVGGPEEYQTYILIANPYNVTAHVTITFLRENGAPFDKTFTIQPQSRFNVDIGPGTLVPELSNESFGAIVASTDAYIAVERAMYSNANGQVWAAGTNATGAPLP